MTPAQKIKLVRVLKRVDPAKADDFLQEQLLFLLSEIPNYFGEHIKPYAKSEDLDTALASLNSFIDEQIAALKAQSNDLDQKHTSDRGALKQALEALVRGETAKLDKELRKHFSSERGTDKRALDKVLDKIKKDIEELYWVRSLNGSNNVQAVLNIKSNGTAVATNVTGINFTTNLTTTTNPDGTINVSATGGGGSGTVTSIASADGSVTVTSGTTAADLAVVKAPKFSTARTIAGVSFDGTANISLNNNAITNGAGYTTNTGTVTTASVVSANGFAGTVANPGTTPAITLTTSVTGVLKGNGTAISAAVNSDLPAMTSTVGGAVPTPPNDSTKFLRGDGVFAVPPSAAGGIVRSINSISTATTAGATAATDYVYLVSGTSTLTLPTAISNTNQYVVKNTGSNTVTVATTSAQTIDGSSTVTLPVANTSLTFISDNANWRII